MSWENVNNLLKVIEQIIHEAGIQICVKTMHSFFLLNQTPSKIISRSNRLD